ncbi:hypothetical protein C8J57DRAFT_1230581 [Mycena rebaudengoi]|nr:hypothetical protein C8J57DRAFT_1230581 [Mycena rebaudengoi]
MVGFSHALVGGGEVVQQPGRRMALDPDHHHQNLLGGSPPPAAGSVHPRLDDDTPSESDASDNGPVTKSPHTRRILKKTRTAVEPLVYDHPASPTPRLPFDSGDYPELDMLEGVEYRDPSPEPAEWAARPSAEFLDDIDHLLHRALAACNLAQMTEGTLFTYPARLQLVIRALSKHILPDSDSAPTPVPTFADVASAAPPRSDRRLEPQPPGNVRTRTERPSAPKPALRPTPAKPRKSAPPTASSKAHSPQRLILCWTTSPPALDKRASVSLLAAVLNDGTREPNVAPRIAGVNWTANGSLVIHALPPYTASQLLAIFGEALIEAMCQECGSFAGPAVLELDMPWLPVVVHGIPALPLLEALKHEREDFWFALEQTGNGPSEVKAVQVLCWDDDYGKREKLFIRLTFSDVGAARQLLGAAGHPAFSTYVVLQALSIRVDAPYHMPGNDDEEPPPRLNLAGVPRIRRYCLPTHRAGQTPPSVFSPPAVALQFPTPVKQGQTSCHAPHSSRRRRHGAHRVGAAPVKLVYPPVGCHWACTLLFVSIPMVRLLATLSPLQGQRGCHAFALFLLASATQASRHLTPLQLHHWTLHSRSVASGLLQSQSTLVLCLKYDKAAFQLTTTHSPMAPSKSSSISERAARMRLRLPLALPPALPQTKWMTRPPPRSRLHPSFPRLCPPAAVLSRRSPAPASRRCPPMQSAARTKARQGEGEGCCPSFPPPPAAPASPAPSATTLELFGDYDEEVDVTRAKALSLGHPDPSVAGASTSRCRDNMEPIFTSPQSGNAPRRCRSYKWLYKRYTGSGVIRVFLFRFLLVRGDLELIENEGRIGRCRICVVKGRKVGGMKARPTSDLVGGEEDIQGGIRTNESGDKWRPGESD